jgi:hypothetical protein
MTQLTELIEQGKKRHAALVRIRKPYKKLASLASTALFAYNFLRIAASSRLLSWGLPRWPCFFSTTPVPFRELGFSHGEDWLY